MNRRDMLKIVASIIASPYVQASTNYSQARSLESLKLLANKKNMMFGTSVGTEIFRNARYSDFVLHHCSVITPENQLKWKSLVPVKKTYNFTDADRLYDFSNFHDLELRGHSLVFEKSMRNWISDCGCDVDQEIIRHIRTVTSRYPNIHSWDLFNEIVDAEGLYGWLRQDSVLKAAGVEYLKIYSSLLKELNPRYELLINDWVGPYKNRFFRKRRHAFLKMLEYLRKNDISIDTLGIQSHLMFAKEDYDSVDWLAFVKNVKDMGFKIKLSELDLSLPSEFVAANNVEHITFSVRSFLEDTLSFANVNQVICWGLIDSYAYSLNSQQWTELEYGPAPFNGQYELGVLGNEIYLALRNAPAYEAPM